MDAQKEPRTLAKDDRWNVVLAFAGFGGPIGGAVVGFLTPLVSGTANHAPQPVDFLSAVSGFGTLLFVFPLMGLMLGLPASVPTGMVYATCRQDFDIQSPAVRSAG